MSKSKPRYKFETPGETIIRISQDIINNMDHRGAMKSTKYLFLRDGRKARDLLKIAIRGDLGILQPSVKERAELALDKIERLIELKSR